MFVGHYSVSFAAKSRKPGIPLWVLFIAVQLLDVFWSLFVWLGIEKVRIVPGITATNPLDLYYMPYTHGLVTAILWSVGAYIVYRWWKRGAAGRGAALVVGVAVFSHWVLDFIVHRPDLPLWDNAAKVGLGLWNHPVPAFLLEVGVLALGLLMYMRATRPTRPAGRFAMPVFAVFMVGVHSISFFGAPPESPAIAAGMALGSYIVLAAIAAWLDRMRSPVTAESEPSPAVA